MTEIKNNKEREAILTNLVLNKKGTGKKKSKPKPKTTNNDLTICKDEQECCESNNNLKPCDQDRPYLHSFVADLWTYLTPDIIDILREMLVKEFGMQPREAEEFLLNQRMKTIFKGHKAQRGPTEFPCVSLLNPDQNLDEPWPDFPCSLFTCPPVCPAPFPSTGQPPCPPPQVLMSLVNNSQSIDPPSCPPQCPDFLKALFCSQEPSASTQQNSQCPPPCPPQDCLKALMGCLPKSSSNEKLQCPPPDILKALLCCTPGPSCSTKKKSCPSPCFPPEFLKALLSCSQEPSKKTDDNISQSKDRDKSDSVNGESIKTKETTETSSCPPPDILNALLCYISSCQSEKSSCPTKKTSCAPPCLPPELIRALLCGSPNATEDTSKNNNGEIKKTSHPPTCLPPDPLKGLLCPPKNSSCPSQPCIPPEIIKALLCCPPCPQDRPNGSSASNGDSSCPPSCISPDVLCNLMNLLPSCPAPPNPSFCPPGSPPYPCCVSPERSILKVKSKKKKQLGLRYYWAKEFIETVSIKLNDYIPTELSIRRTRRVRCISEKILKHLCDITGETCTLNTAKTRAQKILVYISDRIAVWLAKISCRCDEKMRELCDNKEDGGGDGDKTVKNKKGNKKLPDGTQEDKKQSADKQSKFQPTDPPEKDSSIEETTEIIPPDNGNESNEESMKSAEEGEDDEDGMLRTVISRKMKVEKIRKISQAPLMIKRPTTIKVNADSNLLRDLLKEDIQSKEIVDRIRSLKQLENIAKYPKKSVKAPRTSMSNDELPKWIGVGFQHWNSLKSKLNTDDDTKSVSLKDLYRKDNQSLRNVKKQKKTLNWELLEQNMKAMIDMWGKK